MSGTDSLRRVPQQARGAQRITKILDAADELFAETGYEAATTNAIAARANTSIGSLYQFFPNKEAIFTALAQRYATELSNSYDKVLGTEVFLNQLAKY
jgi:AcrR family transcriptional regulator